jgi:hypothetical protein
MEEIHEFLRYVSESKKPSQSQKSFDGLTKPQLCDWLAPWCCPMPSPSEDISYYNMIKLMIKLGELTYWSSVISVFVFVIHKHKFVICDL